MRRDRKEKIRRVLSQHIRPPLLSPHEEVPEENEKQTTCAIFGEEFAERALHQAGMYN